MIHFTPAFNLNIRISLTETAHSEPAGTGPGRDSAKFEALVGGVAGPVGSRRGGAGPLLPADNGEQRQN